jgi:mycothiol system anti-sigma-R factor
MECEEARFGLYALLDNELDVAKNLEILSHLEGCPACQRELELDMRVKAVVREQLSARVAPPELWGKVVRRIEREAERARHPWPAFDRLWPTARLFPAVLVVMVLVVVVTLSLVFITQRSAPSGLVDALVMDHLRSMTKASGPADVPSADPAEIVARFRAEVPPSSPVPWLLYQGARLVGGSFCHLGTTKGLRFTYAMGNGRTVSLYQLDRSGQASFSRPGSGYRYVGQPQSPGVVLWGNGRFLYALVGELPLEDLQKLASHVGGT